MKKIFKNLLAALAIAVFGLAQAGPAMAAKPNPIDLIMPFNTIVKAKKPAPAPGPVSPMEIEWKGNGTDDGYCSDLSYSESAPAGKQRWLFILTSPAVSGPYKLTTDFDPNTQEPINPVTGVQKGNGAVHFTVDTEVGAKLEEATAEPGTSVSILTVSHCTHGVKPLEVEKTAETSFTRTWDWEIDKVGKDEQGEVTDLGEMEADETKTVTYEITLSAEDTDSDYLVEGEITITNPADNPTATIESIIDELDLSDEVVVTCPEELSFELAAGAEVTCDYSQAVDNMQDALNTVTVDAVIGGLDLQTVATANVEWSEEPTLEIDECVTLIDTNSMFAEGGEVCAADLEEGSKTFSYEVVFGDDVELTCGENDYDNTASFVTKDTSTEGESSWTITYNYLCPVACSFSQGYWFEKPGIEWPDPITIGGHNYTQEDGLLVRNSSNQGGITHAKKAFLQLATVLLSFHPEALPAPLDGYQTTINEFLTDKDKVTGNNITENNAAVNAAADAISTWIGENHCTDEDSLDQ